MARQPIIGCTTYRKVVTTDPYLEVCGLGVLYEQAIVAAGGVPLLIPPGLTPDALATVLERVDGVLLPGGGDIAPHRYNGHAVHPTVYGIDEERDETELYLARQSIERDLPLLAICRGHQVLNVALGGTLWQDVADQMPESLEHNYYRPGFPRNQRVHEVSLRPGSRLGTLLGRPTTPVNSLHHQGIQTLAAPLSITATAPDGLIEGAEVRGHRFAVSVQWHPEELVRDDPAMLRLFEGLVAAAAG